MRGISRGCHTHIHIYTPLLLLCAHVKHPRALVMASTHHFPPTPDPPQRPSGVSGGTLTFLEQCALRLKRNGGCRIAELGS